MQLSLLFMSASLATAVLAAPVAEESTKIKRAAAPSKKLVITIGLDANVGLKKRDAAPNDLMSVTVADGSVKISKRDDDDGITVAVGADASITKRKASNDVASISIDADGTVHIGKRAAVPNEDDGIGLDADLDVDIL